MLHEAEREWCLPVIAKVDCHKRLWDERIILPFSIAALAVFAHAPESEAKSPKLAIRTIAALQKNIQKLTNWGYSLEKCVRIHTVETINGVSVGRGVIVTQEAASAFRMALNLQALIPNFYNLDVTLSDESRYRFFLFLTLRQILACTRYASI